MANKYSNMSNDELLATIGGNKSNRYSSMSDDELLNTINRKKAVQNLDEYTQDVERTQKGLRGWVGDTGENILAKAEELTSGNIMPTNPIAKSATEAAMNILPGGGAYWKPFLENEQFRTTTGIGAGLAVAPLPTLGTIAGGLVGSYIAPEGRKRLGGLAGSLIGGSLGYGASTIAPKTRTFQGMLYEPTPQTIDKQIDNTISKTLKPSTKGKKTVGQRERYFEDARSAVKDIANNRGNLGIESELPESLDGFSKASKGRMDRLYDDWSALEKRVGKKTEIDMSRLIKTVENEFTKNEAYNIRPELQEYATNLLERILNSGKDVNTLSKQVKILNDTAAKSYGDPSAIGRAKVDATIAGILRNIIDDTITKNTGSGVWQSLRNLYKSHKTIEGDINAAVLKQAKQVNEAGLNSLLSTFGDANVVAGILMARPELLLRGVAQKTALGFMKWITNPNRLISNMFKRVSASTPPKAPTNVAGLIEAPPIYGEAPGSFGLRNIQKQIAAEPSGTVFGKGFTMKKAQ